MALMIEEDCTNCDVCVTECPNDAIDMGAEIYEIDPAKCTECIGAFEEAQCVLVCPMDCIVDHPEYRESEEQLMAKYAAAH